MSTRPLSPQGRTVIVRALSRRRCTTTATATPTPTTISSSASIAAQPRAWHEILKQYHGQPYPVLYRAFGNLRHKLGRTNDPPWYRYTLSATPFSWEAKPQPMNHSDPRHIKTTS
jgi:2,5-furandicarboxylate decarboxylase 1